MEVLKKKHANADFFLNIFVQKDEHSQIVYNTAILLSRVISFTKELFVRLQHEQIIPANIRFEDVEPLFDKRDTHYQLNAKLHKYLKKMKVQDKDKLQRLQAEELKYYQEELEKSRADMALYKNFYKGVLELLIETKSDVLGRWIVRETANLINYQKEHGFLKPLLEHAFKYLHNSNAENTPEGKLALGSLFLFLGIIRYRSKNIDLNFPEFNEAIDLFQNLREQLKDEMSEEEKERWASECGNLLDEQEAETYHYRGEINLENYRLKQAIADFQKADSLILNLNTIASLGKCWHYLGAFQQEEPEWIRMSEYLSKYKHFQGNYLFSVGRYYEDIGLMDEALRVKKAHFELEMSGENNDDWRAVATRDWAMIQVQKHLQEKTPKAQDLRSCITELEKSMELFNGGQMQRFRCAAYVWVIRGYMQLGEVDNASDIFETALEEMMNSILPVSRAFYELHIVYAELLLLKGSSKESLSVIEAVYKGIKENLGIHHPLLKIVIAHYLKAEISKEKKKELGKHLEMIERLANPAIRVEDFEVIPTDDEKALLHSIRTKNLSLLPDKDNNIKTISYKLPFFKTFRLLKVVYKGVLIRYFLYRGIEEIFPLDLTNGPIYEVSKEKMDGDFSSPEIIRSYIKFFLDAVVGGHGKFYLIDKMDSDFPWHYQCSPAEMADQKKLLSEHAKPLTFLFKEDRPSNGEVATLWHFSSHLLFKDTLFFNRVEVNGRNGIMRIYGEEDVSGIGVFSVATDTKAVALN